MAGFFLVAVIFLAFAALVVVLPLLKSRRYAPPSSVDAVQAAYQTQVEELQSDLNAGTLAQAQYDNAKRELDVRLKEELAATEAEPALQQNDGNLGRLALILELAVPIAAAALYAWRGHPESIGGAVVAEQIATASGNQDAQQGANGNPQAHDVSQQQIETMVQKLADRLKQNPNDVQGWYMLGRSLAVLGRFDAALKALEEARNLDPNEPVLMAEYADIYATTHGNDLHGKPMELVKQALKLDPTNTKALALAGTAAFRDKDYKGAEAYWQRLRNTLVPTDGDKIAAVEANINEARAAQGLPPIALTPPSAPAAAENAGSGMPPMMAAMAQQGGGDMGPGKGKPTLSVHVELSPAMASKVSPDDALFVYAKAASGPPMPIAVIRTTASELPKTFTLDDSMSPMASMAPMMKLSSFPELLVSARISKSGQAVSQPGDLIATVGPVKAGASGVKLTIDSVVQ